MMFEFIVKLVYEMYFYVCRALECLSILFGCTSTTYYCLLEYVLYIELKVLLCRYLFIYLFCLLFASIVLNPSYNSIHYLIRPTL